MLKLFDIKLNKYKKIRELGMPLMTEVMKTVPKELFYQAARDLKMLDKREQTVIMETEDEVGFIMDRAIHDIPWPEKRWIEYLCEQNSIDYTPEQQSYLKAHLTPFFSLYEVIKKDYGSGVHLFDLFANKEIFLMDVGLGETSDEGMLIATRIIAYNGLHFTAGASMPFAQEDKKRLIEYFTSLHKETKDTMTWENMMRRYAPYFFIEFKRRGNVVSFTPATGQHVENTEEFENTPQKTTPDKVGRNAPCPCGSGKKYKKCCLYKDEERRSSVRPVWDYAVKKNIIKNSDNFPVVGCYVNSDWQESGLATITVTRDQGNDNLIFGVFLVDIFCLGVKNTYCNADMPAEKFEKEIFPKSYGEQKPIVIGINYAKEIIFGAVDYAENLGFKPQEDFDLTRHVLGTDELQYQRNIKFGGPNKKPLYIAGPDDNYKKIVLQLTERLGKNGFDYIKPVE